MKRKILMTAVLLSAVALFSSMSFAHNIASGCGSNADVTISDESNWKTVCSKTMSLGDGTHYCVATASAQIQNPGGGTVQNLYRFTIDTNSNPLTNSAYERTVNLDDNSGTYDPDNVDVATVRYFNLASGTYTFYWLARPVDTTDADATIEDYSMGIVCVDGK